MKSIFIGIRNLKIISYLNFINDYLWKIYLNIFSQNLVLNIIDLKREKN